MAGLKRNGWQISAEYTDDKAYEYQAEEKDLKVLLKIIEIFYYIFCFGILTMMTVVNPIN